MGRDGARAEWQDLSIDDLRGLTLIVGASDTGKSTFAHWLTAHLSERGRDVAHIDGDPGQSDLGPPATITLRQTHNEHWRWFVGATTPRGHTLPLVAGARRLADRARGADAIVYDTTGFVHSRGGGLHLKQALVDVLRPRTIVAIQAADELKPIVEPLRRRSDLRLRELPSAAGVCTKTRGERHAFRRHRFQ
ncbi:MAG: Clp1/GlmU family protein, partial [Candidatus Bipolaricaulia bacterium]